MSDGEPADQSRKGNRHEKKEKIRMWALEIVLSGLGGHDIDRLLIQRRDSS